MKYIEIAEDLKIKILNEELKEGDKIPSENILCEQYECSKITIKKALLMLSDEGLVFRQRGNGTYVMKNALQAYKYTADQFLGFTRTNQKINSKTLVSKFEIITLNESLVKLLGIMKEDYVYSFRRVRYINDEAILVEDSIVPMKLASGITAQVLEKSLYEFVEKTTNLELATVYKNVSIVKSSSEIARLLSINEGDDVVLLEEFHALSSGEIFEYAKIYNKCEHFTMSATYHSKS